MVDAKQVVLLVMGVTVFVGSIVSVIVFYPSALAQSNYYVRPTEMRTSAKLPSFVTPISYDIHLHPRLETGIMEGQERIVLNLDKLTTRIALHTHGINITGLNLHTDGEILTAGLHTEHEKNLAYFSFQRPIEPGRCVLELSFRYHLREDSMTGAYVGSYYARTGYRQRSKFLATYLSPSSGARNLFPSFDEPHFKANFTLSIVTPDGYSSIASTMATDTTHLLAGGVKVHFKSTLTPISPHKLGFVVAPFKSIETTTKDGILLRVWAEEGYQAQSRLALRLALDGVDFLVKKLGLPFPVRKVDMVALPDFVEDMTQSSGLCMFDAGNLIYDVSLSPSVARWRIAVAVWRCLASHWFDDLVSPLDASHQWFSDALSMLYTSDVFSDSSGLRILGGSGLTDSGDDGVVWFDEENSQLALEADSMPQSHPLLGDAEFETRYLFDEILTHKGAAVLDMFRTYMNAKSPGSFEQGVRLFLTNSSDTMRTTSQLFAALDFVSGLNIGELAQPWVSQPSYPSLEVSIDFDTITIKQHPFLLFSTTAQPLDRYLVRTRWNIPLVYYSPNSENSTMMTLVTDSSQSRITCHDCLPGLRAPVPSPSPTPVSTVHTNRTHFNSSALSSTVELAQSAAVAVVFNQTVRELEIAKEKIAILEAENAEAHKHIIELEDQLKSPSLSLTPSASPRPRALFDVTDPDEISFVTLNHKLSSFVRVLYPDSAWTVFSKILASPRASMIHPIDRAALLDDVFNFALNGDVSLNVALGMCTYLTNETHPLPWKTALKHLGHLSSLGYEEPWVEQLSFFVLSFLEPAIFSNGLFPSVSKDWKPHPLTPILLEAAVDFKSVSVTAELTSLFPGGLTGLGTSVSLASVVQFLKTTHPDIRCAVLKALVASGAPGTFEAVMAVYKHSILPCDKRNALRALSLSRSHHERIHVLSMAIEGTEVSWNDALMVFEEMAHNHEGRSTSWRKLKDSWDLLHMRYVHGDLDIGRLVKAVVAPFTSDSQHQDIKEFFDTHNHKGAEVAVISALETVRFNSEWIKRQSAKLEKYLQEVQIKMDAEKELKESESDQQLGRLSYVSYEDKDEDLLQLPLKISVS